MFAQKYSVIQECDPASYLLVAIPTFTGHVEIETTAALMAGCVRLTKLGVRVALTYITGVSLQYARNYMATQFLESPATDMLIVDADVGFEADAMVRIALARRPFVAGIYPLKVDGDHWPICFGPEAGTVVADVDGFVEVPSVPGGFLRLNRGVFQFLDYDEATHTTLGSESPMRWYFRDSLQDEVPTDSDVDLCQRWRALGGKVHLIPDLTFQHVGRKVWTSNWANSTRK